MKTFLRTVSPVHIGTGKILTLLDYIGKNRIDFQSLINVLTTEQVEEFDKLIETKEFDELSLVSLLSEQKIDKNFITDNCTLYKLRKEFHRETREAIKTADNQLFIPGSSIKGMFRTCLMYKALKGNNNFDELINKTLRGLPREMPKRIDKIKGELDNILESEVFYCGIEKIDGNGKAKILYNDQKFDILKLLRISDSSIAATSDCGDISELEVYALYKQKKHKAFVIFAESISAGVNFEFELSVDVQFLNKAKDLIKSKDKDFSIRHWISIADKVKNLFDVDLNSQDAISEEQIIESVLSSVREFGQEVCSLERRWYDQCGSANSDMKRVYETKDIAKLGFASGFSATTILTLLLKNSNTKEKAKKIFELLRIGEHRSREPLDIESFPYTLKFIKSNTTLIPMGWCQLSTKEFPDSITEISTSFANHHSEDNTLQNQEKRIPPSWIEASVIDITTKPLRVKMLTGKFEGQETIMPVGNTSNLGITLDSRVYVELTLDKKKRLVKAEYRGKA
jgi:CRISPR type III-A-associated RAMP protein Csm5